MASGKEIGQENYDKFVAFCTKVEENQETADWINREGNLNRSAIAEELGINRKAFRENPHIAELLKAKDDVWGFKKKALNAKEQAERADRANNKVKQTERQHSLLLEKLAVVEKENRQLKAELAGMRGARAAFLEARKDYNQ